MDSTKTVSTNAGCFFKRQENVKLAPLAFILLSCVRIVTAFPPFLLHEIRPKYLEITVIHKLVAFW